MADGYHEDGLSDRDKDFHRVLKSLQEEIEAVDWYNQRAAASKDEAVKKIILHNRNEEMEHACMLLEWLRRNMDPWEDHLKTYLFTELPITEVEAAKEKGEEEKRPALADLGIGDLKLGGKKNGHSKA